MSALALQYLTFSADDDERTAQMAQLKQLRGETVAQRAKREALKRKREDLHAARLAKIKQRREAGGVAAGDAGASHARVWFAVHRNSRFTPSYRPAGDPENTADAAAGDDDGGDRLDLDAMLAFYRQGGQLGDEASI